MHAYIIDKYLEWLGAGRVGLCLWEHNLCTILEVKKKIFKPKDIAEEFKFRGVAAGVAGLHARCPWWPEQQSLRAIIQTIHGVECLFFPNLNCFFLIFLFLLNSLFEL